MSLFMNPELVTILILTFIATRITIKKKKTRASLKILLKN